MPSINHYIPLTKHTRIRLNTCEGQNNISREIRDIDTGKWAAEQTLTIDDEAALSLAHRLIREIEYV